MWFSLRKNTHKRIILWSKLGSLVGVVHLLLLFFFFFIYQDRLRHLSFIISPELMQRVVEFRIAVETVQKVAPKKQSQSMASQKQSKVSSAKKKVAPKPQPIKKSFTQSPGSLKSEPFKLDLQAKAQCAGMAPEYTLLYQEIASHWTPPPGVPADCTCSITIAIDQKGNVIHMNVDNSSGMLMYDLAARAALSELQVPRFAWSRSITITFTV